MKAYKTSAVVFLLAICIIAIALGYAGSKSLPEENSTFVVIEANPTGMIIPRYLITDEVENVLSEIKREYPDNVLFDDEVTLIGSETVDSFENSINENNIDFDWTSVYPFYQLEASLVTPGPYIVYSSASSNSVTISYDELEKILNGDNETVSYYRELLNNSNRENNSEYSICVEGENASVLSVVITDKDNSSLRHRGVIAIGSSGNYSE
ncbi:TPA: hypothetical protein HA338_09620 [Methanosarcina acetivorans]|uniref:Uncharacterized protein n=2 Tax=Methanosarcina acetivorans TaxID=2214 RepID=Q8TI00_METAC|nr:hypothetical protein [Methanosarcina acetivorans]AAM07700.1 predicted protein [Methanosarcina acetivorans C2A]HIH94280.1 hypothetical protein [Methanosarcina acetivorans]